MLMLFLASLACLLVSPEVAATASVRERRLGATAKAKLFQTAADTSDRLSKKDDVSFGEDFAFAGPTINVDEKKGQTIVGFGGSFTEAAAVVFDSLSYKEQEKLLHRYFGPDGIGYTMGRVHINSCDFSLDNYDFDGHDGDTDLVHFDTNVSRDMKDLIPLILRAKKFVEAQGRKLRVLGSPWSPPSWMKTNGQMDGSGQPCLKDGMQGPWAKYMAKWVTAYKGHQVPIWGITVQNEPGYAAPWDACAYSPEEEADFLGNNLGPEMQDQHPDVRILAYDHNKDHLEEWADAIYNHPTAGKYASGLAFHWYTGDGYDAVQNVHTKYPEALLLASEATFERVTSGDGAWDMGEGYAHDVLHDLNAGSVGWIDWNLLLNQEGGPNHVNNFCDAAMMVDDTTGAVKVHPQYFYLGHFSKFILQDSVHLQSRVEGSQTYTGNPRGYGTCTGEDGLQATAFERPDGQVALVVLNCGDDAVDFKIKYSEEQAARASIPAHAIQTYLIQLGVAESPTGIEVADEPRLRWSTKTGTTTTTTATKKTVVTTPELRSAKDEAAWELRSQRTGCLNWADIGMGEATDAFGPEVCGQRCQDAGAACLGFGYQISDDCSDGGIRKGACMIWKGPCVSKPNSCMDDYLMLPPTTTTSTTPAPLPAPGRAADKTMKTPGCRFLIGREGEQCPEHALPLTEAECKESASKFGGGLRRPFVSRDSSQPRGCFFSSDGYFQLNSHPNGSSSEGSTPYCKVCHLDAGCVFAAGRFGDAECPARSEPLTEGECLRAQERLASRQGLPFKVQSAGLAQACVWARTHFFFNVHQTGGQAPGSAPFCKYCGDAAETDAVLFRKYDSTMYRATGRWQGRVAALSVLLALAAGLSLAASALLAALRHRAPWAGSSYAALIRSS